MYLATGLGLGPPFRNTPLKPLWQSLVEEAEAAAQAAGASLWYVPPAGYADRSVNGPFVGSDGSGGVPAVGSGPVGWLRDAANGPLATPELVTNGNFANALTGWTQINTAGGTCAVVGGAAVLSSPASGDVARLRQSFATIPGRTYLANVGSFNANTPSGALSFGTTGGGIQYFFLESLNNGSTTRTFVATDSTLWISAFVGDPSGTVTFDSVSVREIPGSHATQSTSPNRPILVAAPGAAAAAAGFGALSFDGSNDDLGFAPGMSAYPVTLIAAGTSTVNQESGFLSVGSSDVIYRRVGRSAVTLVGQDRNEALVTRTATATVANGNVISAVFASGSFETFLNGASAGTNSHANTWGAAASYGYIGRVRPAGFLLGGVVGLACTSPNALTTAQRQAIERLGAYIVGAPYPGL